MSDVAATTTTAAQAAPEIVRGISSPIQSSDAAASVVHIFGYNLNVTTISIILLVLGVLFLFYKIQSQDKLDFADMVTKDGRAVSLTKVLQLVGGITATWIMIKLTITGGLSEALFGLYLTYVGAIEGYSKFVAAKYNYTEKSIKDIKKDEE